jgi:type I restriction enzyme R subunit
MDSYRLTLQATRNIVLEQGEDLKPIPTEMRGGANEPELDKLSNIIDSFNQRYGTQFEDTDKVRRVFDSLLTDMSKSDELINSIKYSDDQNARITNDKILQQEFLKHITTNFDLYKLFSDNREFQEDLSSKMYGLVRVSCWRV